MILAACPGRGPPRRWRGARGRARARPRPGRPGRLGPERGRLGRPASPRTRGTSSRPPRRGPRGRRPPAAHPGPGGAVGAGAPGGHPRRGRAGRGSPSGRPAEGAHPAEGIAVQVDRGAGGPATASTTAATSSNSRARPWAGPSPLAPRPRRSMAWRRRGAAGGARGRRRVWSATARGRAGGRPLASGPVGDPGAVAGRHPSGGRPVIPVMSPPSVDWPEPEPGRRPLGAASVGLPIPPPQRPVLHREQGRRGPAGHADLGVDVLTTLMTPVLNPMLIHTVPYKSAALSQDQNLQDWRFAPPSGGESAG